MVGCQRVRVIHLKSQSVIFRADLQCCISLQIRRVQLRWWRFQRERHQDQFCMFWYISLPSLYSRFVQVPLPAEVFLCYYGGEDFFLFSDLVATQRTPGKFSYIWHFNEVGIIVTNCERARIQFDIHFLPVPPLLLNFPIIFVWWLKVLFLPSVLVLYYFYCVLTGLVE